MSVQSPVDQYADAEEAVKTIDPYAATREAVLSTEPLHGFHVYSEAVRFANDSVRKLVGVME